MTRCLKSQKYPMDARDGEKITMYEMFIPVQKDLRYH